MLSGLNVGNPRFTGHSRGLMPSAGVAENRKVTGITKMVWSSAFAVGRSHQNSTDYE